MKQLIAIIAVFLTFALSMLVINSWFIAMLNGGTLHVSIDAYGEMWAEYVLWLVLTPVLVLGFHYALDELSTDDS